MTDMFIMLIVVVVSWCTRMSKLLLYVGNASICACLKLNHETFDLISESETMQE